MTSSMSKSYCIQMNSTEFKMVKNALPWGSSGFLKLILMSTTINSLFKEMSRFKIKSANPQKNYIRQKINNLSPIS